MVTYPGLPVPVVSDWLPRAASQARYAPGTTFQIGKIELLANTGTYIDAPFHRYDGGKDVADYPLQAVANLEGVVVRATGRAGRALDPEVFRGWDLKRKAVLVHTGWDVHWRTERYGTGHPFLTRGARSTSTTQPTACAPCTRSCSRPGSPSWSTCVAWPSCRTRDSGSTRFPPE